jgi:hypothetical protein
LTPSIQIDQLTKEGPISTAEGGRHTTYPTASSTYLSIGRPRKAQHGGALRKILVEKLSDPLMGPVQCLGSYIYTTDVKRNELNSHFLLLGVIALFKDISSCSKSRWIEPLSKKETKNKTSEAGIDLSFTAHSTRSAAASQAVAQGVTIGPILPAGDWAAESTLTNSHPHKNILIYRSRGLF